MTLAHHAIRERWLHFYISTLRDVLEPQENRILEIFDMCNGWEGWLQVELSLELKRKFPKAVIEARMMAKNYERREEQDQRLGRERDGLPEPARKAIRYYASRDPPNTEPSTPAQDVIETQLCEFKREKQVYKGNQKRCDFAAKIMMQVDHFHCHFIELKGSTKGQLCKFIQGVHEDLEKVAKEKPDPTWAGGATRVSGWVMAIAVVPLGEEEYLEKLYRGLEKRVSHNGVPMYRCFDSVVKIGRTMWVWIDERPKFGCYA